MTTVVHPKRWWTRAVLGGIILTLTVSGNLLGQTPLDWEPFGVDRTLQPEWSSQMRQWELATEEAGIGRLGGEGFLREKPSMEEGLSAFETRLGPFRLYLSRYRTFDTDRGIQRRLDNTNTSERFKTLPSDVRENTRRAFESVGEIFQPQLNLGIEF